MGRWIGASALALMVAMPLTAQSLTSVRGLGHPLTAVDARGAALGGLGIGLHGLAVPMINPASAAGVQRRGAMVSVASVEQTAAFDDVSEGIGATRFPLIQLIYPIRGAVLTAGYGAYLDQSWGVVREGEDATGAGTIGYRDRIESTGGVGQFQVGAAFPVGDRLAVGAAVGMHTGERQLEYQRLFDTTSVGTLQPFVERSSVQYSAPLAQVGVRWDPDPDLRIGASLTWGGTLSADSASGVAESREYDLPLRVAVGASGHLGGSLLATVATRWSGWSSVGDVSGAGPTSGFVSSGRDTWEVGGGLEWDDPSRSGRSFPLRVGGEYRQLPFTFASEAPTEWFVGGGLGLRIGASPDNPLARIDFTVQRGERSAPGDETLADFSETAWRFVLSLSVFGT